MKRILIIDDDEIFLNLMSVFFEANGFDVATAVNGEEGLKRFRDKPADLVITDIIMPKKEGIDVIIKLKNDYPDINIIAMSGGGEIGPEAYLHAAKSSGAARIIAKPFKFETLLEAVQDLLM